MAASSLSARSVPGSRRSRFSERRALSNGAIETDARDRAVTAGRASHGARRSAAGCVSVALRAGRLERIMCLCLIWIGELIYLDEPGTRTRGAQVTSLDAVMCGVRSDARRIIFAF